MMTTIKTKFLWYRKECPDVKEDERLDGGLIRWCNKRPGYTCRINKCPTFKRGN